MPSRTHLGRAVVVDADEGSARNLAALLSQWGYDTSWAASSWTALDLIQRSKPNVAVIDAGLPVTSGWRLTQIVRSRFSADEIKLIVLAARTMIAPPAHERVYDALLVKPVVIKKLREAVEACSAAAR
jgi:DNA-binding response OmpR family regulator